MSQTDTPHRLRFEGEEQEFVNIVLGLVFTEDAMTLDLPGIEHLYEDTSLRGVFMTPNQSVISVFHHAGCIVHHSLGDVQVFYVRVLAAPLEESLTGKELVVGITAGLSVNVFREVDL